MMVVPPLVEASALKVGVVVIVVVDENPCPAEVVGGTHDMA